MVINIKSHGGLAICHQRRNKQYSTKKTIIWVGYIVRLITVDIQSNEAVSCN